MTVLLAAVMVLALGTWIPLAQLHAGTPDRTRLLYVALGNVVFAGAALAATGGAGLSLDVRGFWLPLLGGVVWTAGNYCVFRASATIGLARAAGTWTPLNIVCAFVWGALLFGELDGFSPTRLAVLGLAFVAVALGVLLISGSQAQTEARVPGLPRRRLLTPGLLWALAAGVLWGSYFIPAQWAATPAQASNVPLALGILVGALALSLTSGQRLRLAPRATAAQLGAGVIFGVGNLALLALVSRVGTGTGFTIAQLSLAVNAAVGIWVFHVPSPGSSQARRVLTGIAVAGVGGGVIAALR